MTTDADGHRVLRVREDREQPADDGADVREEVVERDRLLRDDDRHR